MYYSQKLYPSYLLYLCYSISSLLSPVFVLFYLLTPISCICIILSPHSYLLSPVFVLFYLLTPISCLLHLYYSISSLLSPVSSICIILSPHSYLLSPVLHCTGMKNQTSYTQHSTTIFQCNSIVATHAHTKRIPMILFLMFIIQRR